MANTFKFGNGNWAVKDGYALAYNDENNNFKPLAFDFTRASSATRVNRQGLIETVPSGKPRIDFLDNTSGHLLLEPSRTNNLNYSESFTGASLYDVTTTSNFGVSPDGANNSFKLESNTTNNYHIYRKNAVSVTSGTKYSYSVFAKKGTTSYFQILAGNGGFGNNAYANYDLENGNVTVTGSDADEAKIINYGNGWYRCVLVATSDNTQSESIFGGIITSSTATRAQSHTQQLNVEVWGDVFETGSYQTSYIPTEGSSVTRVAETTNATLNSSVLNNLEGTILIDVDYVSTSDVVVLASPHDGASNKRVEIWANGSVINGFIGGSVNIAIGNTTISNGRNKIALAYKSGDSAFYVNGSQIGVSSTSFTISSLTKFSFNSFLSASTAFQNVNQAKLYNTRLSNTELQNLTS